MNSDPGAKLSVAGGLMIVGGLLLVAGLVWHFAGPFLVSRGWVPGKFPGDIAIERENFRFYFPLTTSILASVVIAILYRVFQSFGGK
jgi:hypothetical protein